MALMDAPAFFDTPVFVAGLIAAGPASADARRVLEFVAAGRVAQPLTAWHCCLEFYAVTTRLPEEIRLRPTVAARLVEEEILARFRVLHMPEAHHREFFRAAALEPIVGARIYDTHIAEIALQAGARIVVTENRRDFTPLLRRGVRVLGSAEFAAEARL